MRFQVILDIGESYLYGTASGDQGTFAINLQGGKAEIVLPGDLMKSLTFYPKKARLTIRQNSDLIASLDAKISAGCDIIEIYDDRLLEELADMKEGDIQVLIEAGT